MVDAEVVSVTAGASKTTVSESKVLSSTSKTINAPDGWVIKSSKKSGGLVFQDPANTHNSIRIMPGNPASPNVAQQSPYVVFKKNGVAYDVNGNALKSVTDEAAHIPVEKFDISKMPKFE